MKCLQQAERAPDVWMKDHMRLLADKWLEMAASLTYEEDSRANHVQHQAKETGWGGRDRTSEWRNQNPLPYRLATPQTLPPIAEPPGPRNNLHMEFPVTISFAQMSECSAVW